MTASNWLIAGMAHSGHPAAAVGALLAALPDPHGAAFPTDAWLHSANGAALRLSHLNCRQRERSSWDGGLCKAARPRIGPRLRFAGKLGHINVASGIGDRDTGWELLRGLRP